MRATWLMIGLVLGVGLAVIAAGLAFAGGWRLGAPAAAGALYLLLNPVLVTVPPVELGRARFEDYEATELARQEKPRAGRHEWTLPHYVPASYDPATGAHEPRSATVRVLPLPGHATLARDGFDCSCGDCMGQDGYWPRRSSPAPPAVGNGTPSQRITGGMDTRRMHDYSHAVSVPGCEYCQAEQRERGRW